MKHFFPPGFLAIGRWLLTLSLALGTLSVARAQSPAIVASYSGDPINTFGFPPNCYTPPAFPAGAYSFTITDNSPRASLTVAATFSSPHPSHPGGPVAGAWVGTSNVYRITTAQLRAAGMEFETLGTVELTVTDPNGNTSFWSEEYVGVGVPVVATFTSQLGTGGTLDLAAQLGGTVDPNTVFWQTLGDGTFDDQQSATPIYTPGPNDLATGSVDLVLQAQPVPSSEYYRCMAETVRNVSLGGAGPAPVLSGFSPASANVGGVVVVTGTNLQFITTFTYSWLGATAPFTVNAAGTQLSFTVTRAMQVENAQSGFSPTFYDASGNSYFLPTALTILDRPPVITYAYTGDPLTDQNCYAPSYFPVGTHSFTIIDPDAPTSQLTITADFTETGPNNGSNPTSMPVTGTLTGNVLTISNQALFNAGFYDGKIGSLRVLVDDPPIMWGPMEYIVNDLTRPVQLEVDAGTDQWIQASDPAFLNAQTWAPAQDVYFDWQGGDGVFSDPSSPFTSYTPGPNDLAQGYVDLYCQLYGLPGAPKLYCSGFDVVRINVIPPAPTIIGFTPTSGPVGTNVDITGTDFTGVSGVWFNNTFATSYTVNSASQITASVPAGATSGPISVATAGGSATSTANFTVTTGNSAPTALALSSTSVAENTGANAVVGTLSSTDPNAGNTFTYTLVTGTGSTDNALVNISGNSLRITASPNFEAKASYAVRIRTTDQGGLTFERAFTIAITNVNEAPAISAQTRSIAENSVLNTNVGAAIVATDPDAGTTLTYSILSGNTGGAFSFGTGGQLRVATPAALDFETTPTFTLTVRVSDGTLAAQNTVTVSLTDVAETPTISSFTPTSGPTGTSVTVTGTNLNGATAARVNGTAGTITGTPTATNLIFTVGAGSTTGAVSVTGPGGTATGNTFTVTTPNQAPTGLGLSPQSIAENTASGTAVGNLSTTDPNAGNTFTYTLVSGTGSTHNAQFSIVSGQLRTAAVFDYETTPSRSVRIRTTDQGGLTFEQAFTITITNVNEAPAISAQTRSIAENSANGTAVGAALSATDPDAGTTLAYSIIGGNTGGVFSFGTNGQLQVANVAALDFETTPTFTLTVRVSDGSLTASNTVTVNLSNVVEGPGAPTISGFTPTSGPVGTVVTISGTNLSNATAVRFNGTAATTSITGNSATGLTVTVPAGATTGTISVTTAGGTATSTATFTVTTAPAGLTFYPTSGAPGSVVLVSGSGFTAASDARFNGASATGTNYQSATVLTATVPNGATSGPLSVRTGGATLTGSAFTVLAGPAPRLTQFTPLRAPVGVVLTLYGANFTGVTAVRFGTLNAPGFTVVSASQITVPVPAGAQSGVRIHVLTSGGGMAQSARAFTLIPPPTLSAMFPTYGTAQALVQLTGTNLTNTTSVSFNGTDATAYTVNSATSITATIPIGATSGLISVTTVAGTATTPGSLTVNTTPAAPSITGFTPASGLVGAAVTVLGTSLNGATQVRFGTTATTISGTPTASTLSTNVPAGATTAPVWVLTPGGLAKSATNFTVAAPAATVPAPVITALLPTFGTPGAKVLLTGTNLTGASAVVFTGGAIATYTVNSATGITATVPAGATTGPISVVTAGGATASPMSFTLTAPTPPTLVSFSPISGPVGQVVTVTGTGFSGATGVLLNRASAPFSNGTATSLTFTVPAGATTGLVGVIGAGGLMLSTTSFTVIPPPTITAFTPTTGSVGSQVVLTGTNLTGATSVRFGGVNAPTFVVNSATTITVTVPVGAATGVLGVTTAGGSATSTGTFTVTAPAAPTISGFTPASGVLGTWVTVTGTNFSGTTQVRFNGTVAESFVVLSATSIAAPVPDKATTGPITVRNAGGEAVSSNPFTVTTAPDIDAFTPVRGPVGTVLTLSGEGFTGATSLTVGGTAAITFTAISDKKMTATVPTGALSGQLRVTTPVATGVSAQSFTVTGMRVDSAHVTAANAARLGLYPNPASGTVTVYLQDWQTGGAIPTVELIDALGRCVRRVVFPATVDATTAPITLLGVPTGVYIVRCGPLAQRLVVE